MDLGLAGKCAIVTGGSRGIGKAIALELARERASIVIVARHREALQKAAEEIKNETGSLVVPIVADTSSDDSVREMVKDTMMALGGIDILVNAAAEPALAGPPLHLAEIDESVLWPDLNVKVLGYLRCMREVTPHMAARGGGRIVNIAGLAARTAGSAAASVRNVAVAALTKNGADELSRHKISAVVVHPGPTRTDRTPATIRSTAKREGRTESEVEARMNAANLLGRLIDAQDVAWVVTFLCSPRAAAINGDAIAVAGGIRGPIYY